MKEAETRSMQNKDKNLLIISPSKINVTSEA